MRAFMLGTYIGLSLIAIVSLFLETSFVYRFVDIWAIFIMNSIILPIIFFSKFKKYKK